MAYRGERYILYAACIMCFPPSKMDCVVWSVSMRDFGGGRDIRDGHLGADGEPVIPGTPGVTDPRQSGKPGSGAGKSWGLMESPLRVLEPQPEVSGKAWAAGLASKVRSWLLLLASVGLRLLSVVKNGDHNALWVLLRAG